MTGISKGTKVYARMGEQWLPAVVLFHHFASNRAYDLYTLRVAEYSQVTQRWQVSNYGPVQSGKLTRRETIVPGLDEEVTSRPGMVPQWVQQLQG